MSTVSNVSKCEMVLLVHVRGTQLKAMVDTKEMERGCLPIVPFGTWVKTKDADAHAIGNLNTTLTKLWRVHNH